MPIPKPEPKESQNDYVGRCMHAIASEYDTNEQAVAICINTYQKGNMNKTTQERVNMKTTGINLIFYAKIADEINTKLAEEGGSYPWDECISDQEAKYGAEAAPKICGYIKSENG